MKTKKSSTTGLSTVGYNNRGKYFQTMRNREKRLHKETKQVSEAWRNEVETLTGHFKDRLQKLETDLERSQVFAEGLMLDFKNACQDIKYYRNMTFRQRVHYVLWGY